jgi:hypothetical protein
MNSERFIGMSADCLAGKRSACKRNAATPAHGESKGMWSCTSSKSGAGGFIWQRKSSSATVQKGKQGIYFYIDVASDNGSYVAALSVYGKNFPNPVPLAL